MDEADFPVTSLLAWCAVHVVLALVTHELGHAFTARLLGGRVHALGWGIPSRGRVIRVGNVILFVSPPCWSGLGTWSSPPLTGWTRWGWSLVVLSGPVLNLLVGATLLAFQHPLAAVIHLLHGVANLFPSLSKGGTPSDGDQLWRLARGQTPSQAALQHVPWRVLLRAAHAFTRWCCPPMARVLWEQLSTTAHDGGRPLLAARARTRAAGAPRTTVHGLSALSSKAGGAS